MKTLLCLYIFTIHPSFSSEITECSKAYNTVKSIIDKSKHLKKISYEINLTEFEKIKTLEKDLPECRINRTFPELDKVTNELTSYQNSSDNSNDLAEKDCPEIKIETKNMPLNNDQKNLPWCWAWSATDLLSFFYKTPLSSLDIATQTINNGVMKKAYDHYKLKINGNIVDYTSSKFGSSEPGKSFWTVLNSKKGFCKEVDLNFFGDDSNKMTDLFYDLTKPGKKLTTIICDFKLLEVEKINKFSKTIITVLNKLDSDNRSSAFVDLMCSEKRVQLDHDILPIYISKENVEKGKTVIEELDKILTAEIPISVYYDSEVIRAGKHYKSKTEGNHFSTVIGRKFNKDLRQCEYILKNSWGSEDCQQTPSIRCDEKGNHWISRTALTNSLYGIHFLFSKKEQVK